MKYLLIFICICSYVCTGYAQRISIQYDAALPQAGYAAETLKLSALKSGYTLDESQPDYQIVLEVTAVLPGISLYSEGFMALNREVKRVEYISVDWQIRQPPIDPDYVSILDYVNTISAGGTFAKNKVTPPVLINMLENDNRKALNLLRNFSVTNDPALEQEVADVRVWANLGLYFAEKLKGGVALQTYRVRGGAEIKDQAIRHLENALKYWDEVVSITKPLYNHMPLVHISEQDGKHWKENDDLRFHWELLRPEVAKDIEIARHATTDHKK